MKKLFLFLALACFCRSAERIEILHLSVSVAEIAWYESEIDRNLSLYRIATEIAVESKNPDLREMAIRVMVSCVKEIPEWKARLDEAKKDAVKWRAEVEAIK